MSLPGDHLSSVGPGPAGEFSIIGRRGFLTAGAAVAAVPAAFAQTDHGRARLTGDRIDPNGEDSGRLVPSPPKGYWPYPGISGPGRPADATSIGQGWVSGLPDVRYRGPDRPRYPVAPWGDAATALAVRDGHLPALRPIHHVHIRDTIIRPAPDGSYWMTGSTGDNIWATNEGVELWQSRDLAD